MKKFNKFLALGLAGASILTGGFMLSGCDITQDDTTQTEQGQDEQKVVSSISLNVDSLPSYIIKGKFNRTNIKATVTYEDNTTKVIDVTESMLGEIDKTKLNYVGQYNLTINYSGKTAKMYANIVDERYLLKEVVEANLDKDVSVIFDDGWVAYQMDRDNKVIYSNDPDGYESWFWLSNNLCYNYEIESGIASCNKGIGNEFDKNSQDWYMTTVFSITNEANGWTIDSIVKDGINYILTATKGDTQLKYYFNEDFMYRVEEIEEGDTYISNYNYSIVNLNVPAEIKALESSATINVEDRIYDLKYEVIEDYLKSDFEMNIFDNSTNTTFVYQQYDANNKILKEIDHINNNEDDLSWVNGDYYYAYYYATNSIYKYNISSWDRDVMVNCFTFDEVFENCTVDISADGQYYELILPSEDGDGEVWEYKYIFNNNEIARVDIICNNQYMGSYTYNKTNVVLEVPAEIKSLESSAK